VGSASTVAPKRLSLRVIPLAFQAMLSRVRFPLDAHSQLDTDEVVMQKSKKALALGMNPSTASHRLVKDILWSKIENELCYRCNKPMTRDTFSIEHKEAWLSSDDPLKSFFDLENITFSHLLCNITAGGQNRIWNTDEERVSHYRKKGNEKRLAEPVEVRQQRRREQYLRTGK